MPRHSYSINRSRGIPLLFALPLQTSEFTTSTVAISNFAPALRMKSNACGEETGGIERFSGWGVAVALEAEPFETQSAPKFV